MKSNLIFLTVLVLLFLFFVGCDSDQNTGNPSFENPPFENIPNINRYDAIFIGEYHTARENFNVQLSLMKYYYSLGVRDFAFEYGYGHSLLFQYYIESGNEDCLEVIFKNTKGTQGCSYEAYNFYKDIYRWNSTLRDKIRLHSFDVEHQPSSALAAIFFLILMKYDRIEGIPGITIPGTRRDLINDFNDNRKRYSGISAADMSLLERIMTNVEQGEIWQCNKVNDEREQYMIDNYREIIRNTRGRKVFAIMGASHASLTGNVRGSSNPMMANALKKEIRIGSIVLRQNESPGEWPYIIKINENLSTTPFNSTYTGNWPWDLPNSW